MNIMWHFSSLYFNSSNYNLRATSGPPKCVSAGISVTLGVRAQHVHGAGNRSRIRGQEFDSRHQIYLWLSCAARAIASYLVHSRWEGCAERHSVPVAVGPVLTGYCLAKSSSGWEMVLQTSACWGNWCSRDQKESELITDLLIKPC